MHSSTAMATTGACQPLLWPASSAIINTSFSIPRDIIINLQKRSNKLLQLPSHPIPILGSSGKIDMNDPHLIASREALKDAERAALLALTYRLTRNVDYFHKTREILTNWARVNKPTGNPIDETKLEGMIWAYDLIACDLSDDDNAQLLDWFKRLRKQKLVWTFGPITRTNNYRVHQLKMLLLLDKVLRRYSDWQNDIDSAVILSTINLHPTTGMSVDYLQRNALYYHNYVIQPWIEISLITGSCWEPVKQAFAFLSKKIQAHQVSGEFLHSKATIDTLRAGGGFKYAIKGGTFDISKAAPTIVMYYTVDRSHPESTLWLIQQQTKPSPWLDFLRVRRVLWQP